LTGLIEPNLDHFAVESELYYFLRFYSDISVLLLVIFALDDYLDGPHLGFNRLFIID
jgi:hypothetical protein